ncbi:MAG: class I SAM-dependent methyltransferase [Saprospiraceae bacterium]|nr:class I SAM-dependent methyltransferase [Saprospiraceae bacterium]
MSGNKYIGKELEIFSHAKNWKSYYGSLIKPYFGERLLEVGAGLGTTTSSLYDSRVRDWFCLEPDESFISLLRGKIHSGELPPACKAKPGTINDLEVDDVYDTIIYIDVMEHIQDDHAESHAAARHLKPGGRLIVLAPAHPWMFTPFDQAIGHFRRYSKISLEKIKPVSCEQEKLVYLDSLGMLLSCANKILLKQSLPTIKQILFWDRWIVPFSKILDRGLMYRMGRSMVTVWRKRDDPSHP